MYYEYNAEYYTHYLNLYICMDKFYNDTFCFFRVMENVGGTDDKPIEEVEVEITFPYFLLLSRKNKQ